MPIEIKGVEKLKRQLEALSLKGSKRVELEVGYNDPIAIHVHENIEAKWRGKEVPRKGKDREGSPSIGVYWGTPFNSSQGQPKFLEKAYRRLKSQTGKTIREKLKAKRSLFEAVLAAGRDILALSLTMVPVNSGKLYLSGFVRVVEGG